MKNKKLLLIATAAMGVVALGTGAVSTIAWFQVTAQGSTAKTIEVESITAVKPTGDVAVVLPLSVALETSPTNLELAHWFAAGDLTAGNWSKGTPESYAVQNANNTQGLYTAFHLNNQAKTLVYNDAAISNTNALWADIDITVTAPTAGATIDGVFYSQADIATMLNGNEKVDVVVEGASYAISTDESVDNEKTYYELGNAGYAVVASPTGNPNTKGYYERTESRAKIFSLGTSTVAAAASGSNSLTFNNSGSGTTLNNLAGAGTVFHFGIYIDGNNNGTVDGDTFASSYTVTVKHHA